MSRAKPQTSADNKTHEKLSPELVATDRNEPDTGAGDDPKESKGVPASTGGACDGRTNVPEGGPGGDDILTAMQKNREALPDGQAALDQAASALQEERARFAIEKEDHLRAERNLAERSQSLWKREKELVTQKRALEEREANARAGFTKQDEESLEALTEARAALQEQNASLRRQAADERTALDAELEAQRQREYEALAESIQRERDQARKRIDADRQKALKHLDIELRKKAAVVDAEIARDTKRVQTEAKELVQARKRIEGDRRRELKELETELRKKKATADDVISKDRQRLAVEAVELEQARQRSETERHEAVDAEIREKKAAADAEVSKERKRLEAEAKALKTERVAFEELKQEHEEAISRRDAELRRISNQTTAEKEILEDDVEALDKRVELKAGAGLKKMRDELELAKERIRGIEADRKRQAKKLLEYEEVTRRFGGKSPKEVLSAQRFLKQEAEKLRAKLAKQPGSEALTRLQQLETQREEWEARVCALEYENSTLKSQRDTWLIQVTQLETLRDANQALTARIDVLNAGQAKLQEEIGGYKSLTEQPKEREARVGIIEEPNHTIAREPENPVTKELAWLDRVSDSIEESGFDIPRRLLDAFHTSLKIAEWAPLTVIAGVSGTGKSELPRLYSRFGGLQFEPVAVQPNWDSPQDLFGFFNYIDNKFNAKPVLRAMAQSQREPDDRGGFNDGLLMVLLDEMNLAHVEHYFSDLLSKLELRRGSDKPVYHEVDLGAGLKPLEIPLGINLLFVGTMNEDETTHILSDKTLDRGNVITFPRPTALVSRDVVKLAKGNGFLARATWEAWNQTPASLDAALRARFRQVVDDINECMARARRAMGHRVWQAMEHYIANHPRVRHAAKGKNADAMEEACTRAFEDQLVQKVMPKLRGIETDDASQKSCLEPIGELIQEHAGGLHPDYKNASAPALGSFLWHTADYLRAEE